jgi:predicted acylesterase/phospholipase RssA
MQGERRTQFERIVLLLQGGGALGSYQAGVYQALSEANLHPDWIAGISIGAINSALIAGNPPAKRVERLREFWETVSESPVGIPYLPSIRLRTELAHRIANHRTLAHPQLMELPDRLEGVRTFDVCRDDSEDPERQPAI